VERRTQKKLEKGGHPSVRELEDPVGESTAANYTLRQNIKRFTDCSGTFCTACSLAADEAALIVARFYMSPPADPGRASFTRRGIEKPARFQ
jgi:hypothetical protein